MQNTKDLNYLFLIKNDILLIYREIKRVTYKVIFDKTSKYINYTNKVIYKLVNNVLKQIYFLFKRYL